MATAEHEWIGFEQARVLARRRRMRLWFPIGVVLLMLIALIGIAIYNYRVMRADTLTLSKGVVVNLQSRIETEVSSYLHPIGGAIRLAHDLLGDRAQAQIRTSLFEPLARGVLGNMPQLTSLIVGMPNGDFLMVRRFRDGAQSGLETKIIEHAATAGSQPLVKLARRNPQGAVISDKTLDWDGYDPRKRPWYDGVIQADQLHWTDVYPFFTDRAAGVTASLPVIDDQGERIAVIGADVKLESLSHFLAALKIGATGFAFIVDNEGRVIAHPHAELVKESDDGKLRLTRVADLTDPVAGRAFDRFRVEGHGGRDFELGERRYISSVSSLRHLIQRDWSVIVVVPEDDFVGFVVGNVSKTLSMGLAVILLAGFLAALLIRQGLRTDREALRIVERQAQLDAQSQAFGSLAVQSALFDSSDDDALAPVSEAVASAAHVRRASIWRFEDERRVLQCIDAFDQDAGGHTRGSRLQQAEHPELFEALLGGGVLAEVDAGNVPTTASLYRHYLDPLGCRALLSVPVSVRGEYTGVLWLEDGGRRGQWPGQTVRFVQAIANLLAIREVAASPDQGLQPGLSTLPDAAVETVAQTEPGPARTRVPVDIDTGLAAQRATAFTARLSQQAGEQRTARAGLIDELAVLSLHFTDAVVLAESSAKTSDDSVIGSLIRELEQAAVKHDLAYMKFLSDQVVVAADPNDEPLIGMRKLAAFALDVRAICERLFAEQRAPLAFRIGLDLGPVIGSVVGSARRTFNLWGEAAQMASDMALTGLPGSIQVTETVYRALAGHYLFQLRGRHYLENVGEFSTYLMSGRL